MSPRKIPESVLSKSLTTNAALDRLICGIDVIERDFNPGKYSFCNVAYVFLCMNLCLDQSAIQKRTNESSSIDLGSAFRRAVSPTSPHALFPATAIAAALAQSLFLFLSFNSENGDGWYLFQGGGRHSFIT